MIQAHAGENKIVDAVSQPQRVVDIIKERDDVIVALYVQWMKVLLNYGHAVKCGKHGAAKVDPVNAPRIFLITAIRVFNILWQDKKFVWAYLVSSFADLIPTISIHAVKDEVLW